MTPHTTAGVRLRTRDLTYIALFTVLTAVCAWISIPVTTISFTLQTFAVFAALLALGGRRGTYAVAAYLLLGAVGLPVFSNFQGGAGVLLGATGGYILGFLAAALTYWGLTARRDTPAVRLLACLAGLLVCYVFGTGWFLAVYTGGETSLGAALALCVAPFVVPDLVKIGLAVTLAGRVRRFLK